MGAGAGEGREAVSVVWKDSHCCWSDAQFPIDQRSESSKAAAICASASARADVGGHRASPRLFVDHEGNVNHTDDADTWWCDDPAGVRRAVRLQIARVGTHNTRCKMCKLARRSGEFGPTLGDLRVRAGIFRRRTWVSKHMVLLYPPHPPRCRIVHYILHFLRNGVIGGTSIFVNDARTLYETAEHFDTSQIELLSISHVNNGDHQHRDHYTTKAQAGSRA
ncbi:hypothetical protein D9619_009809 [Psilocybe cf. subviscida]|uniref:Uncharacterized protein n=1 Tax=Psilocybe cf. subviscida TaxID=2480587 RepID=A0A8H5BM29_9AGAR|nr:hypothetical protein D9619_009809 [Psilocybe cf. subviscida]